MYRNPLREDNNPSAGFYYGDNGMLFFHDFASGKHYNFVSVVKEKYNLSYVEALDRIKKDKENIHNLKVGVIEEEEVNLQIVLSPNTHNYFSKLGISDYTLNRYGVSNVKCVYRNGKLHWRATLDNPIFSYSFPSGRIKLYRPLSVDKAKKWYGNSNAEDVAGLNCLPKSSKLLILTKSMKDVMVLREMGFNAISFNGESVGSGDVPYLEDLIRTLKYRFENIVLLYDNDEAGVKHSLKLEGKYRLRSCRLTKGKDISDVVSVHSFSTAFKHLKKCLSKSLRGSDINTPY